MLNYFENRPKSEGFSVEERRKTPFPTNIARERILVTMKRSENLHLHHNTFFQKIGY